MPVSSVEKQSNSTHAICALIFIYTVFSFCPKLYMLARVDLLSTMCVPCCKYFLEVDDIVIDLS